MDVAVEHIKVSKARKIQGETARDRFLRLAPPRMDGALKKIKLLGNLAGSGYQYEPNEAQEMVDALTQAVDEVRDKFSKSKSSSRKTGFEFKRKRGS
jgi:hypothetical protein